MTALTTDSVIALYSTDRTAQLAAAELQRTLQRIGGPRLPVTTAATDRPVLELRHGDGGDGFVYLPTDRGGRIVGDGPRGLLYGVYALLEQLGCRWTAPGSAGEELPRRSAVTLPTIAFAERPAVAERLLIIGHDSLLDSAADWIVWAARARYSGIFVHTGDDPFGIGACRIRSWQRARVALLPLLAERGLTLEIGGHHAGLLPRRLLRRDRLLQRFNGRRRVNDINACLSAAGAQQLLRAGAAAFARSEPAAARFHLWPADRPGDGWCRCADCAGLSAADQALRFANLVAAGVAEVNPAARVTFLAYHDSAEAPLQLSPAANVDLCFAPRRRSYSSPIDRDDALNRPLWTQLQRLTAHFSGHAALAFEYYSDGLLHKSALPVFAQLPAADAAAYAALGCGVALLMTGDRRFLTAGPTPYQLGRLLWDPTLEHGVLLDDYLQARRSAAPQALRAAYHAAMRIWQCLLQHDPAERPAPIGAVSVDIAANPPRDVLDFYAAPPAVAERRLQQLAALDADVSRLLPPAAADTDGPAAADWFELQALADLVDVLVTRQRLAVLLQRRADRPALRSALAAAHAAVHGLQRRHRLAGGRANQTALFDLLHQLQLDRLARGVLSAPQWLALRLRAPLRLAGALLHITIGTPHKIG